MALSRKDRMLLFVTDVLSTATLNESELHAGEASGVGCATSREGMGRGGEAAALYVAGERSP